MIKKPLLILTPLALELKFLKEFLTQKSDKILTVQDGAAKLFVFEEFNCALATGGHGKVQYALRAQHWLRQGDYRGLICAGSCGALVPAVRRFDLVLGEVTVEHDHVEKFTGQPRPEFLADAHLLQEFRSGDGKTYKIHRGRIASGDEDIVDHARAKELQLATQAIAVAWEGAGGARAARFMGLPFLELRAVTDDAGSSAIEDFKKSIRTAMHNLGDGLLDGFLRGRQSG